MKEASYRVVVRVPDEIDLPAPNEIVEAITYHICEFSLGGDHRRNDVEVEVDG